MNDANSFFTATSAQAAAALSKIGSIYAPQSVTTRLTNQIDEAEGRLKSLKKLKEVLESEPKILEVLDLMRQVGI